MSPRNLPPPVWNKVNVSENLGKTAALTDLPMITPRYGRVHTWGIFSVWTIIKSKACSYQQKSTYLFDETLQGVLKFLKAIY